MTFIIWDWLVQHNAPEIAFALLILAVAVHWVAFLVPDDDNNLRWYKRYLKRWRMSKL